MAPYNDYTKNKTPKKYANPALIIWEISPIKINRWVDK